MKNSFAVYCPGIVISEDLINPIKKRYINQNYDDFVVFTDIFYAAEDCRDHGIMSTFYMKFFRGKVIFLNQEDYIKYKDNILGEAVLYEVQ